MAARGVSGAALGALRSWPRASWRQPDANAFQVGVLSVSLPVIDTVEPVSAVIIGATVFSESLATSPAQLSV